LDIASKRRLCTILVVLAAAPAAAAERDAAKPAADQAISASWRLVENREDRFKAELKLVNGSSLPLADGWALYFNSAAKLLPDSLHGDFTLTHVNGDFYVLRPKTGLKPLAPGDSYSSTWEGQPWAINTSDAPSGFYLVRDDRSKPRQPVPVPLRIEAFPEPSKLRRGATDVLPVVTAESRYIENESLKKLPERQLLKVVPTPVQYQPRDGKVELRSSTQILCETRLAAEAKFLAAALGELLSNPVAVQHGAQVERRSPHAIRLRVAEIDVAGSMKRAGDEAYVLTVDSKDGVEIVGSDSAGVFYGLQTLRALLPVTSYRQRNDRIEVEAVRIADAPRFRYRGQHLDVARNFHSKHTVMKLLDLMAFYKLNRFHWHLTDDEGWRLEIKQLPELSEVGGRRGHTLDESDRLIPSHGSGPFSDPASSAGSGFYTQDEFIEILRYANARHIAVIPEFDFPGHARAAIKSMEARSRRLRSNDPQAASQYLLRERGDESKYESVQMWRDNVVDVGREATYRFLDVVFGEVADMYQRAGVPLTSIHLGGDEVPNGAWEKSPACEMVPVDEGSKVPRRGQLEIYFLKRASELLARRSIRPACWEDCLLLDLDQTKPKPEPHRASGTVAPIAYVWNNVWGWGREDAAYRLANAGYDVVLSNATHLYLDLAYEKDPLDRGYYWAGFVGLRSPFEFVPLDVFKNADRNSMGQPLGADVRAGRERLTADGAKHIIGIQGQLWAENLRDAESVEYMAFPRMIALAERAWAASPAWANIDDASARRSQLQPDWNQFANRLGQRELPRLDYLFGGVQYRLPPPGVVLRNGRVQANVALPGLELRYTTDGTEPDEKAPVFAESIPATREVKLRTFDSRGRGSRTIGIGANIPSATK